MAASSTCDPFLFLSIRRQAAVAPPVAWTTGRPRGFAFVELANDGEAAKAITELNGKELDGRALKVNEANPKPERSRPRGGEGRDRGGYQPRGPRWEQ